MRSLGQIKYKGTMEMDKSSKRYKVFKCINKHYGCLLNFLQEIEFEQVFKEE